ncbi:2135_t:CDS:1, partial [Ambispora leptoticha]
MSNIIKNEILKDDEKLKFKLLFTSINKKKTFFIYSTSKSKQKLDQTNNVPFLPNLIHDSFNQYTWEEEAIPQIFTAAIQHIQSHYVIEETIIMRDALKRITWPRFRSTANNAQEAEWQEIFLNNTDKYLPGFKYLWEVEWEPVPGRPDLGQNDLIMTNGYGVFAVVEVKLIYDEDAVDNKRIRKVTEQARKYKDCFIKENMNNCKVLAVIGVTFTNQKNGTVRFLEEYDSLIANAIANACKLNIENFLFNLNNLIQNS